MITTGYKSLKITNVRSSTKEEIQNLDEQIFNFTVIINKIFNVLLRCHKKYVSIKFWYDYQQNCKKIPKGKTILPIESMCYYNIIILMFYCYIRTHLSSFSFVFFSI